MARRIKKWPKIGHWLKSARKDAGLTLQDLANRTGVSTSSLARFEADRATPAFGDICVIAQQLGWPLLYFATGQERTGDDTRTAVTHLRFWGLGDIRLPEPALLGEARPFEEVIADVVSRPVNQRVLAALPALLLRNRFEPTRLISDAQALGSLRRIGWLADVAEHVSRELPPAASQPDTRRRLSSVEQAAAKVQPTPRSTTTSALTRPCQRRRAIVSGKPVHLLPGGGASRLTFGSRSSSSEQNRYSRETSGAHRSQGHRTAPQVSQSNR
jgi:transcriptional regulator with XRE-family HTH domain